MVYCVNAGRERCAARPRRCVLAGRSGETGRRPGLKIPWSVRTVPVRARSPAPVVAKQLPENCRAILATCGNSQKNYPRIAEQLSQRVEIRRATTRELQSNSRNNTAGWSSTVARRAHNPKVRGSNPLPATKHIRRPLEGRRNARVVICLSSRNGSGGFRLPGVPRVLVRPVRKLQAVGVL